MPTENRPLSFDRTIVPCRRLLVMSLNWPNDATAPVTCLPGHDRRLADAQRRGSRGPLAALFDLDDSAVEIAQ
jgi:hypothetical protein